MNHNRRETTRLALQTQLDAAKSGAERNRLGQFATPPRLAAEIVTAAMGLLPGDAKIRFLDPGFGTGSFYSALLHSIPSARIQSAAGFEIDSHYGAPATGLWESTGLRLRLDDFTQAVPPNENERFNLLICNPPYVRHHHLNRQQKQQLQSAVAQHAGCSMNGLSGLYCYFLVLSHAWMAKHGIAAWLIPSEFMDVNYGRQVKRFLLERVKLLRIHRFDPSEVQFDDAFVSSAVVFFQNAPPPAGHEVEFTFGGSVTSPRISAAIPVERLSHTAKWTRLPQQADRHAHFPVGQVCNLSEKISTQRDIAETCATGATELDGLKNCPSEAVKRDRLQTCPTEGANSDRLQTCPTSGGAAPTVFEHNDRARLADLFQIKRGLATGCNEFFVLSAEQVAHLGLPPVFLKPILPSPRNLDVDEIPADRHGNPKIAQPRFLLDCRHPEDEVRTSHPALWKYLQTGIATGVDQRYLCRHRTPWYSQESRPPAPFLCTYMGRPTRKSDVPFRFILNHSNATAANVYLLLYPKPAFATVLEANPELHGIVWQALSSLTAEMLIGEGRIYGGGLHKLEPKELANVPANVVLKVVSGE